MVVRQKGGFPARIFFSCQHFSISAIQQFSLSVPTFFRGTNFRGQLVERAGAADSGFALAEGNAPAEHTVHRHVANVLGKLEVSLRAAAEAARLDLL